MTSTAVPAAATVLAYLPSPPQGVWYLGPIALRAYALCIIVGIVVAIFWGDRRWVARAASRAPSSTSPCGRCRSA